MMNFDSSSEIFEYRKFRKMYLGDICRIFGRRKPMDSPSKGESLARYLSTLDLTALGIGSTLGVGVYVLAGSVSKEIAGPAVIISFAIAAVASMIAGLCYAEFGARVPRAGSAYVYSYVTIGEFIAFLIGWTLILEYVIGAASVVRGLSTYVDASLFNDSMKRAFQTHAPINISSHISPYPDFFAFGVTLTFSTALAFGAKESSIVNNVFTLGNLSVVLFVIIAGAFKSNFSNWKLPPPCAPRITDSCPKGNGGFMPFGVKGIISGAATCFYGFIGFDCVATTGEEAKNPQRSIPIAIISSLTIVFLAYFGVSTILTTVMPYYDQHKDAPFPAMFEMMGWNWAKYMVSFGAICGLCASLLGSMYPLPRIIYAMASDGLIFKSLGTVHPRFHTPMIGTLSSGFLTGLLAAMFELGQLINMMSIGTLLAYSIVAACVLILRYKESKSFEKRNDQEEYSVSAIVKQFVNKKQLTYSTKLTSKIVTSLVFCYFVICLLFTGIISSCSQELMEGNLLYLLPAVLLGSTLAVILVFIKMQPVNCDKQIAFTVPFVPFLPGISILINVYLMMMLDLMTWVRFSVWMIVGLGIYFFYGVWNSTIREKKTTSKLGKPSQWNSRDLPQICRTSTF